MEKNYDESDQLGTRATHAIKFHSCDSVLARRPAQIPEWLLVLSWCARLVSGPAKWRRTSGGNRAAVRAAADAASTLAWRMLLPHAASAPLGLEGLGPRPALLMGLGIRENFERQADFC
jgi:hypothetical protein